MISFTIDVPEIPTGLKNPSRIIREELNRACSEAVVTLRNNLMYASPRDTGALANGWLTRQPVVMDNKIEASVGNSQPHALTIEYGTKPYMPPAGAMIGWVQRHITNAVAESNIRQHGDSIVARYYDSGDFSEKNVKKMKRESANVKKSISQYQKGEAQRISFLIARGIRGRGLPSAQNASRLGVFARTVSRTSATITNIFNAATNRISDRLSGGGA